MIPIENSMRIEASPKVIYDLITDPKRLTEWCQGLHNPEPEADYPKPGTRIKFSYRVAGIEMGVTQTSLELEPDRKFLIKAESFGTSARGEWSLTPEENGTLVRVLYQYEVVGGKVAEKFTETLFGEKMRTQQKNFLINIKALVE